MNRIQPRAAVAAVLLFLLFGGAAATGARAQTSGVVAGHLVVKTQPGVDAAQLAADYAAIVDDQVPGTVVYGFHVDDSANLDTVAGALSLDSRVVYAEPDRILSAPENADGNPFHFAFDGSTRPAAYAMQASYTQVDVPMTSDGQVNPGSVLKRFTGTGVLVAVIDTGVAAAHADLIGHVAVDGYNAITPGAAPDDLPDGVAGNGAVGHGTMVAGIIARLAPGATILPVRVLNGDGEGSLLAVAKGIYFAAGHGARVLNMSFGTTYRSEALRDALDTAEASGAVLVASAGNNNSDQTQFPAQGKGTISVASVESNNVKSPYSNYGSSVRVVAPGTNVRSTYWDGGYATWSGTSFAAPFVSAEAALVLSAKPGLNTSDVKKAIRSTARSVDSVNKLYKGKLGDGLIDIEAAVKSVAR